MLKPWIKLIVLGSIAGFIYLIRLFGWSLIIGLIIGFVLANIIFYSNIPVIDNAMYIFTRGRQSNIKVMFNEDIKNEKQNRVKYNG